MYFLQYSNLLFQVSKFSEDQNNVLFRAMFWKLPTLLLEIHNRMSRIPTQAPGGARSYWKHCWSSLCKDVTAVTFRTNTFAYYWFDENMISTGTVEPHLTATLLIQPPHYYNHFILAQTKALSVIFLF